MPSTKRRLERQPASLFALVSLAAAGAGALACSSDDTLLGHSEAPGIDAAPPTSDAAADAGVDADKPPFDGKPLAVTCAAEPCAVSLVTTVGPDPDVRSEGFCALLSDKTVVCWGANGSGQLGRGPEVVYDDSTPKRVPGLSDVVELDHTCAGTSSGDVFWWGVGPFLQDSQNSATITTTGSPVKLPLPLAAHIGIGRDWRPVARARLERQGLRTCRPHRARGSSRQLAGVHRGEQRRQLGRRPDQRRRRRGRGRHLPRR